MPTDVKNNYDHLFNGALKEKNSKIISLDYMPVLGTRECLRWFPLNDPRVLDKSLRAVDEYSSSKNYFDGNDWISNGTCLWNDGVFSNSTSTNMSGLKQIWKMEGLKATNEEISFTSRCSGLDDDGILNVTVWVK